MKRIVALVVALMLFCSSFSVFAQASVNENADNSAADAQVQNETQTDAAETAEPVLSEFTAEVGDTVPEPTAEEEQGEAVVSTNAETTGGQSFKYTPESTGIYVIRIPGRTENDCECTVTYSSEESSSPQRVYGTAILTDDGIHYQVLLQNGIEYSVAVSCDKEETVTADAPALVRPLSSAAALQTGTNVVDLGGQMAVLYTFTAAQEGRYYARLSGGTYNWEKDLYVRMYGPNSYTEWDAQCYYSDGQYFCSNPYLYLDEGQIYSILISAEDTSVTDLSFVINPVQTKEIDYTPTQDGLYDISVPGVTGYEDGSFNLYTKNGDWVECSRTYGASGLTARATLSKDTTYHIEVSYYMAAGTVSDPSVALFVPERSETPVALGNNELQASSGKAIAYIFTPTETGTYSFKTTSETTHSLFVLDNATNRVLCTPSRDYSSENYSLS